MNIKIYDQQKDNVIITMEVLAKHGGFPIAIVARGLPKDIRIEINNTFQQIAGRFMGWSVKTYERSTALSCMLHLKRECEEVLEEKDKQKQLVEFADCAMCLLSAVAREGFTAEQLVEAIAAKAEINYKRTWKLNEDNTYSHVKE